MDAFTQTAAAPVGSPYRARIAPSAKGLETIAVNTVHHGKNWLRIGKRRQSVYASQHRAMNGKQDMKLALKQQPRL